MTVERFPLRVPMTNPQAWLAAVPAACLLALAGCSSGMTPASTPVAPTPTPTPSAITVTVTGAQQVRLGATTQLTATVANTTNTAVTWQVNGTTGGSATYGTISATGLYTAPAVLPSNSLISISAISVASPAASGVASEQLQNPLPTLASATAVQASGSLSFTIDAKGTGFISTSVLQVNGANVTTTFVSVTELTATVLVAPGTSTLTIDVANPDPGAILSASVSVPVTVIAASVTQAARILDQTTFGPTAADIQHVQNVGIANYLAEQFAAPTTTLASIPTSPLPALCLANNSAYPCAESEWWQTAITGNDQLRQRVAFALSEMFVVSTQSIPGQAIPQFHNALANDAFTNFSTIMQDVSLTPAMGGYLNMLNSAKPGTGQIANENYSRELMQLFTMGLYQLNIDGTQQLDAMNNPIPSYSQAQVQAFARAYTGWTLATAGGAAVTKFPNNSGDYNDPMVAVAAYHDTTAKVLLDGTTLGAGQTAQQDLSGALANIFGNANVPPFVCKQLIQHLVTSTPSPGYVKRVANVFKDNGSGVRGDMKAVLTAIFTDTEARAGDTNAAYDGGHLREPILFITAMVRGLGYTNIDANQSWFALSGQSAKLSEEPYRANSVFNFFAPEYVIPSTTLNAPEFGIENTATAVLRLSLADAIVNNKLASSSFTVDLSNTSKLGVMAATPATLVDNLSVLLMHGQMPANMRSTIISTITPLTSPAQRVRIALYLIITSSQYKVIH